MFTTLHSHGYGVALAKLWLHLVLVQLASTAWLVNSC